MLLRSEFSFAINKEVNEEMTQQCKNKTTKNFQGKQQTIQNNSDSDSEYDMLFDKMPVISNKEDRSIEKKQRKANPSRLDNEIVSDLLYFFSFLIDLQTSINEDKWQILFIF